MTGNNSFFVLNQSEFEQWGFASDDVLRLCPPGSRHLRRLAYTEKDEGAAAERGAGVYLFRPGADPSEAAQRYIAYGEELGVQNAYENARGEESLVAYRCLLGESPMRLSPI